MATARQRSRAIERDVAKYLATGHAVVDGWSLYPGQNIVEKETARRRVLREALVERVMELSHGRKLPPTPAGTSDSAFLFNKLEPMVVGLFPKAEQGAVLDLVMDSVVFLDQGHALTAINETSWPHTAWDIGRIWLDSIGAERLSPEDGGLLGLSEGTTCYVSLAYFQDLERDPFSDYVVHEVAHIFHNEKRERAGLPLRPRSEWLLDIEYRKRELFAYACEVYSRILGRGAGRRDRLRLVGEFAENPYQADDRLDPGELVDVVRDAAEARNGWKRILERCSPTRASSLA